MQRAARQHRGPVAARRAQCQVPSLQGQFMRAASFIALATLLAFTGISAGRAQSQPAAGAAPGPQAPTPPAVAELYIFNDSGRTLIPSNQAVTDNGRTLVSLPRQVYARLELQPGPHLLKP